jgi:membrane protein implicated in regulation of membrane protease activity
MAVIVIRGNARAAWLTDLASLCARARGMARRAMECAAAAVMICAVGATLLHLVVEIVSFPAPIAVAGITVITAALLNLLRRGLRARARHRDGPASRPGLQR